MRRNGMLMPISSLPSPYGIGAFSKEAYQFVDVLEASEQSLWQILPLGATGYGDSPYQSFSTFAGNPYFIDLDSLITEGLLTKAECEAVDWGEKDGYIDYEKLYQGRFPLLKIAYTRSRIEENLDFLHFCEEQKSWLYDYALYMAVKDSYGGKSWSQWEDGIRLSRPGAIESYRIKLKDEIGFYQYLQFLFSTQWRALKQYANQKGIEIIGDLPIYVAFDSADTWSNRKLFQLDEDNIPTAVAGCPPDGFSSTGQLWGNPLYQWEYHKETGFDWWIKRIEACYGWYDCIRIDHFRGFDAYYSIPYGAVDASGGHWVDGPGIALFDAVSAKLGDLNIIAEDLGYLTDGVRKLLTNTGYPGMKVLEFAFDSREESDYFPHNYVKNSVVYTGTHDNDTLQGWYQVLAKEDKDISLEYLNNYASKPEDIHWDFICLAMRSVADACIIPVQDYLGLGSEARINTPSTLGGNWRWRLKQDAFSAALIEKIKNLTKLYGRV